MAGLVAISEALAAALAPVKAALPDMQVYEFMNPSPAASPSIDMYPGTPFQTGSGFSDEFDTFWTVRARQTTVDHAAGQQVLLRLLDRGIPESVQDALEADQTLGGLVQSVAVVDDGVGGYAEYLDDQATNGRLIGVEWRVRVITK